jgi:hypothetical protein
MTPSGIRQAQSFGDILVRSLTPRVAIVAFAAAVLSAHHAAGANRVTCTLPNDPDQRIFTLAQRETGTEKPWFLAFQNKKIGPRTIRVKLAGASPVLSGDTATLAFKTSNGGIVVDLKSNGPRGTLDVYVSYELEVNVDTEMTPDVDLMNTNGPVPVACEIGTVVP